MAIKKKKFAANSDKKRNF